MPSGELLVAFILAGALLAVMPGPAILFVTAQTLAYGRRAGFMAVLGVHLGGYAHIAAAAFGLAVLVKAVPTLYLALKLAGAVYLVWLGIGMFRATGPVETSGPSPMPARTPGTRRTFVRSILVQLLNPKVAIFYVAFLPQFTDPTAAMAIGLQFAILGIIVNLMFLAVDSTSVLLADRVRSALGRSRRTARLIGQIGGSLLVALGIRLAFERG